MTNQSRVEKNTAEKIEQLDGKLKNLSSSIEKISAKGNALVNDGKNKLAQITQKKPLASLVIASGISLILGYIIGRKNKQ